MSRYDRRQDWRNADWRNYRRQHREGNRIMFGVAIVVVGICLILRRMGLIFFDPFEWPIILIIIGVLIGIKSGFRNISWAILCLIGIAFEIHSFPVYKDITSSELAWPVGLIIIGLIIALRRPHPRYFVTPGTGGGTTVAKDTIISSDSSINIDVTFGGRKEIVTSKEFKGGVVAVTFAGCEVNMVQADFTDPFVVLNFKIAFGGVELAIPSHWEVQNEINPTFGSVEDQRVLQTPTGTEAKKVLVLRGNCSFGSIEIKSY